MAATYNLKLVKTSFASIDCVGKVGHNLACTCSATRSACISFLRVTGMPMFLNTLSLVSDSPGVPCHVLASHEGQVKRTDLCYGVSSQQIASLTVCLVL